MRRVLSLILAAVMLVKCMACQPTPEKEVVVQRDAVVIEEKINATPPVPTQMEEEETPVPKEEEDIPVQASPTPDMTEYYREQVEAYKGALPERWVDLAETSYVKIQIDAEVMVPNTEGFPVYKITRSRYDAEQIGKISNYILQGVTGIRQGSAPLYDEYKDAIASLNERGFTEYAKAMYAEQRNARLGEYTDTDHIEFTDELEQKYVVRMEDGTLGIISKEGTMLCVGTRIRSMVHLKKMVEQVGSYEGEPKVKLRPSISKEEAQETLETFLEECGLDSFFIEKTEAARYFVFLTREEASQGWWFNLVRAYGYYPFDSFEAGSGSGMFQYSDDSAYSRPWERETLNVYVSEKGVEYFQWNAPMETVELANPCVELMEFSEIQEKMKTLLTLGASWIDFDCYEAKVTKMFLTVVPQQIKNEMGKAYLMPTWTAIVEWYLQGEFAFSDQLCINAIDGSRVPLMWYN